MSTYPHEQLLQILSSLLIELRALQTMVQPEKGANGTNIANIDALRSGLEDIHELACHALYTVRSTFEEMPFPELEGITLAEALSRLVEETADHLNLASRVSFSGVDGTNRPTVQNLSSQAERLLYLVGREALYQVEQHSQARHLRFTLNYGQENVQMSLEDDGIPERMQDAQNEDAQDHLDTLAPPFDRSPLDAGHVLLPIIGDLRSRLELLGGSLEITQSESGTRVQVSLPYSDRETSQEAASSSLEPTIDEVEQTSQSATSAESITPVSILLVDSHAVTRAGLHRLLEVYPGLSVIGEASDGVQAVSETLELGPQVVLMDAQLPNGQSLEALRQIKQLNLDTKVLLLGTQDREEYLYEMLRAGADGYVLKDIAPDDLVQAVRSVARGDVLIQPQLAGRLLSRFGRQGRGNARYETLTTRELEVLRLLARGLRNKEIAARLYVSERTVNFHLANIYQKLNVSGRTEALSKALEQGLVTP